MLLECTGHRIGDVVQRTTKIYVDNLDYHYIYRHHPLHHITYPVIGASQRHFKLPLYILPPLVTVLGNRWILMVGNRWILGALLGDWWMYTIGIGKKFIFLNNTRRFNLFYLHLQSSSLSFFDLFACFFHLVDWNQRILYK